MYTVYWYIGIFLANISLKVTIHCAEFRDTSGTFSIACSTKFEITRVNRRETIKKMAENGSTLAPPCLFSFYTAH